MMNRRACLFLTPTVPFSPNGAKRPVVTPVHYEQAIESDVLYVYRNDRFQALYMVSDNPPGKAVKVQRRVDWYDPITQDTRTFHESVMYMTGTEDF